MAHRDAVADTVNRLLVLVENRCPGANIGTSRDLAYALDIDEEVTIRALHDLVALHYIERQPGLGEFHVGPRRSTVDAVNATYPSMGDVGVQSRRH